ncbi:uncharacterized protein LOC130623845 isoform X2 [Hydractinia symbiolongicarpus]|nr:uncharacterized protein LOC130623845 isoform X2 [Hydractinia symbiolongicarpus]
MSNSRKRKLGTAIAPSEDLINEFIKSQKTTTKSKQFNNPGADLENKAIKRSRHSEMVSPRKFAAIICEDSEKWGGQDYLGKKIIEIFRQNDDEVWEYFKACSDEIPDKNKLADYEAFIVSGSHYSANDEHPWVQHLETFFKDLYQYQELSTTTSPPKLIGVCFGHQLIGKALGARVVKNVGGRFIFKPVHINVTDTLTKSEYYKDNFQSNHSLSLFQSHSEEIIDLPCFAECVASSDNCRNEIVKYGDSVLTFQGHMEITEDEMLEKILPDIKKANIFNEEEEQEMFQALKEKGSDRKKVVDLIKSFMYSGQHDTYT